MNMLPSSHQPIHIDGWPIFKGKKSESRQKRLRSMFGVPFYSDSIAAYVTDESAEDLNSY